MVRQVRVVHKVEPDGKGYERVYAALDGLLWDRPGLVTYYPYGSRVSNLFDREHSDYVFGRKAEVREPLPNRGYCEPKIKITSILSVEMDTRNPDEVVIRSSVFSGKKILEALRNVA